MDYSQFLAMKQEISLLVLFLLVFLNDTFLPARAQSSIGKITCLLFGLFTLWGFCPVVLVERGFIGYQECMRPGGYTKKTLPAKRKCLEGGVAV